MPSSNSRRIVPTALALAALAAGPPAAVAVTHNVDPRSPDARDAANAASASGHDVDLRSPDARDAAAAAAGHTVVVRTVASRPARVIRVTPDGFDWGDAAIGAAGTLGAVLLAAGTATAMTRRRTERHPGARA
jgi:hypothetical protein